MITNFKNVLILAPHTDDGELGAGGTISRLIEYGANVYYAAFSTAEASVPDGMPKDILKTEVKEAKKVVAKNLRPSDVKVEDIMSSPLITASPDEDASDVEMKMRKNKIKRVPVLENGKIIGIVTATDMARIFPEMVKILKESYHLL